MSGIMTSDGYLGIIKQAAHGTALQPTKFVRISGPESIKHSQEIIEVNSLLSAQETEEMYKTLHTIDGGFQAYARPDMAAFLLAAVLGADSVVTGTVNTHTITRANTIPWLTIERKLSSAERIADCKLDQLVITGQAGQPISMDATFLGTNATIETAATPSYEAEAAYKFFEGTYTINEAASTLITGFTITITRNLESLQTTAQTRNNLLEGKFSVDLEYNLKIEDDADYLHALFNSGTAIQADLQSGSFVVDFKRGSGATERELKIDLPALKIIDSEKHLDPETKATILTVTARGIYDAAKEIISVTAKNTVSAAYI